MATRKQAAKPPPIDTPRWRLPGSPGELSPAEQMAHDILADRRDLMPSVERIMTAGLGTEDTLTAMGLFRDALTDPSDMHRDPRSAIATAATRQATAPHAPSDG